MITPPTEDAILSLLFSHFPNASIGGIRFALPKTAAKAQFILATEIARKKHDKNIIKAGSFHLFRLTESMEQEIFAALDTFVTEAFKGEDAEVHLNVMNDISEFLSIEAQQGSVGVGNIDEIKDSTIIKVLASHYYTAFKGGYETYPFLN